MVKVAIVVLNWNGLADTKSVLKDIKKLNKSGLEIELVVVDNGSTDGSVEGLRSIKTQNVSYTFLENSENLGFAGGNNVGIKYSLDKGADLVLILNNDIILDKNFLVEMVKNFLENPKIGAVSPKIYFAKGYEFHKDRYKEKDLGKVIWYAGGDIDWDNVYGATSGVDEVDIGRYNLEKNTDFATGTCMLVSREVLEKVGVFDEKYFLYYEDTDLSVRIKKAGFRVLYEPDAIIWHKVAQSSGIGSSLNDYFITRNRMLFGFKYAKLRTKLALIRESINLLLNGRKWQKTGIRDFYLMRFGKGSWI